MQARRLVFALLCLTLVLSAGSTWAEKLRGWVNGNGGGAETNVTYGLLATAGQPVVGMSEGPAYLECHGFWCFGGVRVVAVDPPDSTTGPDLPTHLEFGLPTPNPTPGQATFSLAVPKAAEIQLLAYDVRGRQAGEPLVQRFAAGRYRLHWCPTGQGSGIYFIRLFVDRKLEAERRVILLHQ